MEKAIVKIPISDIVLDESIYPRETIDHRRIAVFEENIRDGFNFDPIEVQVWPDPDNPVKVRYRILDGRHRWGAYKKTGATHIEVVIITLDQMEPILYAAQMAIGPIGYINWEFPRTGLPEDWGCPSRPYHGIYPKC